MTDKSQDGKMALVAEIDALYAKATPGPWQRSGVRIKLGAEDCIQVGPDGFNIVFLPIGNRPHEQAGAIADADLLRALFNRWPEIRALLSADEQSKAVPNSGRIEMLMLNAAFCIECPDGVPDETKKSIREGLSDAAHAMQSTRHKAMLAAAPQPPGHEFVSTARDGAQETCAKCGEHFTHASHDIPGHEREAHFERLYTLCEGEKDRLREDLRKALAAPQPPGRDVEEDARPCTCHPDDNPPRPCPKKYALSECRNAALEKLAEENGRLRKELDVSRANHIDANTRNMNAESRLAAAEEALERISDMCPDTQEFTVAHSMAAEADAALAKQGGKDE